MPTFDKPFRLRVLDGLTAALEEIAVADGYHVDLDGKVVRGRAILGEEDTLPLVTILEVPLQDEGNQAPLGGSVAKSSWDLIIQGFIDDDVSNPADVTEPAHVMMADVKQRLIKERNENGRSHDIFGVKTAANRIEEIEIGTDGVVRPADEVSAKAFFWTKIRLTLVENMLTPYE